VADSLDEAKAAFGSAFGCACRPCLLPSEMTFVKPLEESVLFI
jgi:hypothetical protein